MKKTSDDMMRNLLNLKEDYTLELDPHSDQLFVEREQLHEDDETEDDKPEEKTDDESSDQENDESSNFENDEPVDQENDEASEQANDDASDQDKKEDDKDKSSEQPKNTEKKETHKLNMVPNVQAAYEDLERAATASDVAISIAKYLKALKSAAQDAISGSN